MTIFPYNRLLRIHTNIDLFLQRPCVSCVHTNTSTHMDALESTDACRWKENISCLISKAQQSIFFPWHLRRLDTSQPIPAQFFWGSNRRRPGIQSGSASSCFQGQTAAPCLHRWLLSRSSSVSCSPSRSCTTPGAKKRAGKIASNQAHWGNYLLSKRKKKKTLQWMKKVYCCIKTQTSHHLTIFLPARRWDLISLWCSLQSRSHFVLKVL